jgi:acetyl-CoA carboxylase biotin carboxyl carrier protein
MKMSDVFEKIESLAALLDSHGLVSIRLREGETEIELRKEGEPIYSVASVSSGHPVNDKANGEVIPSPTVGVFYSRPSPDEPPFVEPGARITVGQVIGIIEAMKVFNQIESPISGVLREIVAEDGQVVQEGDPLFVLEA